MIVTVADLKAHVQAYVMKEQLGVESEVHKIVAKFAEYVEGRQAIQDAIALVEANGYTVSHPPTAS